RLLFISGARGWSRPSAGDPGEALLHPVPTRIPDSCEMTSQLGLRYRRAGAFVVAAAFTLASRSLPGWVYGPLIAISSVKLALASTRWPGVLAYAKARP